MIKIDNSNVIGVSKGDTLFSYIYKGNDLVWRKKPIDISDFIKPKGTELLGDIVLWDRVNQEKIIVDISKIKKFKSTCVPIGIVAIPSSENVYGDGSGSMISLKYMDYNNPDEGSVNAVSIYWGSTSTTLGSTISSNDVAQTTFNQDSVNAKFLTFNPYNWKTGVIQNVATTNNYPAGWCCWRYHTEGTNQGDWYMPSGGELSYIADDFGTNATAYNNTLSLSFYKLDQLGYEVGLVYLKRLHTTTEQRYDQFYSSLGRVTTRDLSVFRKNDSECYCIAFCKI